MECSVCGHRFGHNEERVIVSCMHGDLLCWCEGHGYICPDHQREMPAMESPRAGIRIRRMVLPEGCEMVTLLSGSQVLMVTVRPAVTA